MGGSGQEDQSFVRCVLMEAKVHVCLNLALRRFRPLPRSNFSSASGNGDPTPCGLCTPDFQSVTDFTLIPYPVNINDLDRPLGRMEPARLRSCGLIAGVSTVRSLDSPAKSIHVFYTLIVGSRSRSIRSAPIAFPSSNYRLEKSTPRGRTSRWAW